jgi:hypothetical protein
MIDRGGLRRCAEPISLCHVALRVGVKPISIYGETVTDRAEAARLTRFLFAEFLEARIVPERIEHGIEPEQRRSKRHARRTSVRY